jgi:hypothetical protein
MEDLFSKINALLDIIEKGILDYVAFNHNNQKLSYDNFLNLADPVI